MAGDSPGNLRSTLDIWVDAGAAALLVAAVAAASLLFQRQITVNDGEGWDGSHYYAGAEQVAHGVPLLGEAPFVHRILVPAAAALFDPDDVMTGFRLVNGVAILVVIVLLVVWLRMHFSARWVRLTLIVLFLVQWTGPLRTFFWYPVLVDYWFLAAMLAGLLVIERLRAGGRVVVWLPVLCLVSMVAVAVREIGLLIPVAALFTYNPLSGPLRRLRARLRDLRAVPPSLLLPPLLAAVALAVVWSLAVATGTYSTIRSAGYWLITKSPLAYVLGWFISYGPALLLPLLYWRACARYLREHQAVAVFLVGVIGVSWIGGNDTERFVTWAAPVVYVLIGIGLQALARDRVHPAFPVLLGVAQVFAARAFWSVPADPVDAGSVPELVVLTPVGNDVSVYDLAAWDSAPVIRMTTAAEYAVLCAVLVGIVWTSRRSRAAALLVSG